MTAVIHSAGISGIVESAAPGHPHRRSCCFSPADESKSLHMAGASALATSLYLFLQPSQAHPLWGVRRSRGTWSVIQAPGQGLTKHRYNPPPPSPFPVGISRVQFDTLSALARQRETFRGRPRLCHCVSQSRAHSWDRKGASDSAA